MRGVSSPSYSPFPFSIYVTFLSSPPPLFCLPTEPPPSPSPLACWNHSQLTIPHDPGNEGVRQHVVDVSARADGRADESTVALVQLPELREGEGTGGGGNGGREEDKS